MGREHTCIRCGEDARDATHYRLKDGSHEHTDCRARWEGMVVASALIAWGAAIQENDLDRTYAAMRARRDADPDPDDAWQYADD